MRLYKKVFFISAILLFCYSLYLISLHLFHKDLMFHTDIARDFLLIEEIVVTKDLTLIGPKAGGIPGMFFGPIWLYIHIPLFLLGSGNPMVIAYFWVFLIIVSIWSVFFITNRIFNTVSAVIATLIYSFSAVTFSTGFTQSFGSVLLLPWLLYFMYLYFERKKQRYLIIALLVNGFIYQMQPAVGMITLPVTLLLSLYMIIRQKKYSYLYSYLVLLIPFSTYIIFELRHDFLQVKAFIGHFIGNNVQNREKLSVDEFIINRTDSYFGIIDLIKSNRVTNALFLLLYGFIAYKIYKKDKFAGKTFYKLFFAYIFGFIIVTLLYKGIIIDYYFWAFLPVSLIAFSGLLNTIPKAIFIALACTILYTTINSAIMHRENWDKNFTGINASSWILNKDVAEFIFDDSSGEFGYFVYSPDEFGFPIKYAMNYVQRSESAMGSLCQKKNTLYLIYYPTPVEAKTDPVYWKEVRVNLTKKPILVKKVNDLTVEKYSLTDAEVNTPADPNIVCNLHFR